MLTLAGTTGLLWVRWMLAGSGLLIIFSGIYDRCPVYRAASTRLREVFRKNRTGLSNTDIL
jgi:hypothetical protein